MGAWTQTGSSIIFLPFTLEQALAGLAEAGFVNVEIGAVKGSSTPRPRRCGRPRSPTAGGCSISTG